jgi:glycosyltransferase involved in cell wall biosynthesis
MTASLTVIILTRDEARHIGRCIASVTGLAERIIVVDSGSTDATCALAAAAGAEVRQHGWVNHASQFNWALDHCAITSEWILRLDADEVVTPPLATALTAFFAAPGTAVGVTINRAIHFLGRRIRWGGIYPVEILRLWRTGKGRIENRWMDEHVLVDGRIAHVDGDIADINLNNVGWWTAKHNGYATREAIDQLTRDAGSEAARNLSPQARRKRWLKDNVYARLPLGLRPLLYFLYRYVVLLGFLDGWQGLAFHGLQGLWYRFLVDVKIAELRGLMAARGHDLATVVAAEYGLSLTGTDAGGDSAAAPGSDPLPLA